MQLRLIRTFHASRLALSRWTGAEDATIMAKYEELGPAWTVLSLSVPSRSPIECRRRWLTLNGAMTNLPETDRRLVYNDGYELHNGRLIKIPMERISAGPFAKLVAMVKPVRFRRDRKRGGWSKEEIMAVQEGVEQYGPRWNFIAAKLQYRTGRQCRNMMQSRFISWGRHLVRSKLPLVEEGKGSELLEQTS
ncbi:hypothetical protein PSACC_01065 [Paramicrosporidium saccamoebae]|uniref:Uncharacterized protein n=1 Tax=Paramicrosporidium saccamoebae TaxID=1246581 RepID=A0A2H9TMY1_9FUNG|nr:hypothetical protein PSACC_01065 [Paramicrosporidium saccamoebae]